MTTDIEASPKKTIRNEVKRPSNDSCFQEKEPVTSHDPVASPTETVLSWHEDPLNPHNWPPARKYTATLLLSAFVFNALMSSTIIAPALSQITKDLHIPSDAQTQLVLSIYVLSYAAGYFFWAPLSEVYGRVPVLQVASTWFLSWNMVCSFATSKAMITVGRLFSGSGAAASLAISSSMVGEIWRAEERGHSLAILSIITNLGPCIGPVVGGVVAERPPSSWHWAFWATSILNVLLQLLSIPLLHESHAQMILTKKPGPAGAIFRHKSWRTPLRILLKAFHRPIYLCYTQPASRGIVVYAGISFGTLYTLIVAIPVAFESIYHQSVMMASLNYLSFGIGTTLGAQICGPLNDWLYKTNVDQNSEQEIAGNVRKERPAKLPYKPPAEIRLYSLGPAVLLMTVALLIFGWTLQSGRVHWIVPNIGIFLFGNGQQVVIQCTNAYIIEVFSEIQSTVPAATEGTNAKGIHGESGSEARPSSRANINWTASAMASIWGFKSLCGFTCPLFAIDMIKGLGWGCSFTLLALLNLAFGLPLTIVMLKYGQELREKGRQAIEEMIARS
ncbi:hypothetical protein H2198_000935 [Neophaeococcomyces mojaviensis]|uniref:Uncharacterized protein n=1 Tax=Neophaeococcomyces mojaviensis TaxID=3383035 RepID=A0ACC3AJ84_9EURO|nr:hypothetical protein H2198_000935 [Knufia sp. JES_112]